MKPPKGGLLVAIGMKPKGAKAGPGEDEEEGEEHGGEESAGQELIDAIKSGDAYRVYEALESAYAMCEENKHSEEQ